MPVYGSPQAGGVLTQINPGDIYELLNAEVLADGQASIAFCRGVGEGLQPSSITFTIAGAAAPVVNIEASNQDIEATYQQVHNTTNQALDYYLDYGGFL